MNVTAPCDWRVPPHVIQERRGVLSPPEGRRLPTGSRSQDREGKWLQGGWEASGRVSQASQQLAWLRRGMEAEVRQGGQEG